MLEQEPEEVKLGCREGKERKSCHLHQRWSKISKTNRKKIMLIRIGCGRSGWRHVEERGHRSLGIPGAWIGLQTRCTAWPGSAHRGAVSNEPAWEMKETV